MFATQWCQIARRRRDAQRVQAELQHPDYLIGAVFAAADRDDAIPVATIAPAILRKDGQQFVAASIPIDVGALLIAATGIADTVVVELEVRFGVRHHASRAVGQHLSRASASGTT